MDPFSYAYAKAQNPLIKNMLIVAKWYASKDTTDIQREMFWETLKDWEVGK